MNSPIKPTIKTEIIPIILIILSFVLGLYFYALFPERAAIHWNFQGEADGWGPRGFAAFLLPFTMIGMYLLFLFIPYLDPHKKRYQEFARVYHIFKAAIVGFFFLIFIFVGLFNLGYPVRINLIVPIGAGALFIILGHYMSQIKMNWFSGIRTPWTLSSEKVWNKTHQVGGWLFIIFGIVLILNPFLPKRIAQPLFWLMIFLAVFGTMAYSYWLYRKEQK